MACCEKKTAVLRWNTAAMNVHVTGGDENHCRIGLLKSLPISAVATWVHREKIMLPEPPKVIRFGPIRRRC